MPVVLQPEWCQSRRAWALWLNVRLKGYISHYLYNASEWFLYNSAAENFNTKKLYTRFLEQKLTFFAKKNKFVFSVSQHTRFILSSLKTRGRLPISDNWTAFSRSYGWGTMSENLSKTAFFEGRGSLWVRILDGRERRLPAIVGVRKLEYQNIGSMFFLFVTKHAYDGRTNGQNFDNQDHDGLRREVKHYCVYTKHYYQRH